MDFTVESPEVVNAEVMREGLKNELEKMDLEEVETNPKVASSPLVIPEKVIRSVVRAENALILSALTKDSPSSVKQAAREALEPSKDDIQIVGDFLQEVIKRYAPTTFKDPLTTAAILYAGNISMKIATVHGIKEGMK